MRRIHIMGLKDQYFLGGHTMKFSKRIVSIALLIILALSAPILVNHVSPFDLNLEELQKVTKEFTNTLLHNLSRLTKDDSSRFSSPESLIDEAFNQTLPTINVAKALNIPDAEHVSALTDQLRRISTIAIKELIFTDPEELTWCACPNAPSDMRLALVVEIINDARKTRNPHTRLVYTSLAAGGLLFDYIVMSELVRYGFSNIRINLIDIQLLDLPDLDAIFKQAENIERTIKALPATAHTEWQRISPLQVHAEFLKDQALKHTSYLISFRHKLDALTQEEIRPHRRPIALKHYTHVDDYIARARRHPSERTDILLLIDPSTHLHPLKDSIGANAFAIQNGAHKKLKQSKETFVVFIPKTNIADIRLYSNVDFKNRLGIDPLSTLHDIISFAIRKTQFFTPNDYTSYLLNLIQEMTPQTATIFWISDAYLTLQDLVRDTLADKKTAAVYDLAYPTPLRTYPMINKINPITYPNSDVVTTNIGAALIMDNYKPLALSPRNWALNGPQ